MVSVSRGRKQGRRLKCRSGFIVAIMGLFAVVFFVNLHSGLKEAIRLEESIQQQRQLEIARNTPARKVKNTPTRKVDNNNDSNSYCSPNGKKVFIDLGALDGDSLDQLWRMRPDNKDFKYYAWECNPENIIDLKKRVRENPERDVTVIESAAWIENTTLSFKGGNMNAGKIETKANTAGAITVPALDVSQWILATFKKSDYVFFKIDIEAAEFQVLPRIFETGAIEYIDEMQIEWHDWAKDKIERSKRRAELDEKAKKRAELEAMLKQHGLIYKFATLDVFKGPKDEQGRDNTDWSKVPKYVEKSEYPMGASKYPMQWVDCHYFRQAEGCHSTWDVAV